jgi:hypothetical protein
MFVVCDTFFIILNMVKIVLYNYMFKYNICSHVGTYNLYVMPYAIFFLEPYMFTKDIINIYFIINIKNTC